MNFSGIPSSVASKDLENFILCLFQEIGVDLDELRIVACHRLGKTDRTIVNFLNREDAENVYSKKRKLKDVDISCLLSDDIQNRNDINRGSQNDWRDGGLSRKRKIFIIKESGLAKAKKAQGLIFYFRFFSGTIRMRELHDSRVINNTHESDI